MDGLENDEYDLESEHFIMRDRNNDIAATVRVIANSKLGLPILKNMKLNIDPNGLDPGRSVEISRLIVARKYRKRMLLILLFKGLYLYAKEKNISHAFCVIDEKLYPQLLKLKVPAKIIGPVQLYQGLTFPCVIDIGEWFKKIKEDRTLNKFYKHGSLNVGVENAKYTIS